jgi:DNA processing protein
MKRRASDRRGFAPASRPRGEAVIGVQGLGPVVPRRVAEMQPAAPLERVEPVRPVVAAGLERPLGVTRPNPAEERDAWVTLLGVSGLGPVTFAALLDAFGSATAVLDAAASSAGPDRLSEAVAASAGGPRVVVAPAAAATEDPATRPALGPELSARIRDAVATGRETVELVRSLGLSVVTLDDPAYPPRLRAIEMPPPLLFVHGSLAEVAAPPAVAVVGTRRATDRGRLTAGRIAAGLVRSGAVVVSGLAVGIDGAAHAAAVSEGGLTVAVLGSGHARMFPRAHERLADAIVAAGGAVVSEHPPNTAPSRGTFPRRNRVVSGLSDAVVVVEAGERSGALITAGWALEQGRDCFIVPGAIDDPATAGCNAFLRAFPGETRLVCGVPELLEDLGLVGDAAAVGTTGHGVPGGRIGSAAPAGAGVAAVLASLAPAERLIAELLAAGPATADELAARTGLAAAAVLGAVTMLELRGLVAPSYGRYLPAGALANANPGAARPRPRR